MLDLEKVQKKLRFKYPDANIQAYPSMEEPTEVVCEVEPTGNNPERSVAVAVIGQSMAHHHEKSTETYEVLSGHLVLHLGETATKRLFAGQSHVIKPGTVHWAESSDAAWVRVTSEPGWTVEDHIIEGQESAANNMTAPATILPKERY